MVKKGWFICDCGEEVKITKHKLDTEKGIIYVMSDVEISCFRHNKKCLDCIEKEDDEKKKEEDEAKVNIWRACITYDDDENFEDGRNVSYFKNKEDALDFLVVKFRDLLNNSDSYDEDGDLDASRISMGCRKYTLN